MSMLIWIFIWIFIWIRRDAAGSFGRAVQFTAVLRHRTGPDTARALELCWRILDDFSDSLNFTEYSIDIAYVKY